MKSNAAMISTGGTFTMIFFYKGFAVLLLTVGLIEAIKGTKTPTRILAMDTMMIPYSPGMKAK